MKIAFSYAVVLVIVVASLLSSCVSLQKGEFAQRKYYDFPMSKHPISEKKAEYASVNSQHKTIPPKLIAHIEKQIHQLDESIRERISEPIASVPAVRNGAITQNLTSISKETGSMLKKQKYLSKEESLFHRKSNIPTQHFFFNSVLSPKKSSVWKLMRNTYHNFPFSDAGTMLLVMMVAAILVPPLGVYMKDRPRLTSWFWITLVLCILSGGIFMGSPIIGVGAGLWSVAAIIALMVVLDIIN